MTLYGYARVSVREPEDKNLDLQVERLVRAGCSLGNIRAEEASGARNDRGGLLELLDLVVEGDTLVVTHIDRLSRGLTHGLQVIEGLHRAGVEFRSLSEDFDTATATGKLQLTMVLAFSEWWRNSIRERSVAGQAKARAEGRFPGWRPSLNERQPIPERHLPLLRTEDRSAAARPRGEARGAVWSEIDTGQALWTVPAERMKGGLPHRVPLSVAALEVLSKARELHVGSDLVFPSPTRQGQSLSDMTLTKILRTTGLAERATVHGFRSTFRDWGSETGAGSDRVLELALAHRPGK